MIRQCFARLCRITFVVPSRAPDLSGSLVDKRGAPVPFTHLDIQPLDLSGERDLLTILSGRESTVRRFDEMVDRSGHPPPDWINRLIGEAA